jgi:uroporphyrinogen-III synthase
MRKLRALVTRPRAEAEALAALLARQGIEAVVEPMIEIADREAASPDLTGVRAILCTSANGVRALVQASGERGVPVFAVGDASAAAARAVGFGRVESAGGDVEALANLVRQHLKPDAGKLLHVTGGVVAGDLAAMLDAAGFTVERLAMYEARAARALSAATARLIADGQIDVALFFSPRTAAIFARLAAAAGVVAGLRATAAISISSAADAALGELPFCARLVARAPTQDALIETIDQRAVA